MQKKLLEVTIVSNLGYLLSYECSNWMFTEDLITKQDDFDKKLFECI